MNTTIYKETTEDDEWFDNYVESIDETTDNQQEQTTNYYKVEFIQIPKDYRKVTTLITTDVQRKVLSVIEDFTLGFINTTTKKHKQKNTINKKWFKDTLLRYDDINRSIKELCLMGIVNYDPTDKTYQLNLDFTLWKMKVKNKKGQGKSDKDPVYQPLPQDIIDVGLRYRNDKV